MEAFEAIVAGRVQRVLFRDCTRRRARSLGLVGTVENLPDGTVRVVAEGSASSLEELQRWLHAGSPLAKVTRVAVVWREPSGQFSSFDIVYRSLWDRI